MTDNYEPDHVACHYWPLRTKAARKPHVCDFCGGSIPIGTTYRGQKILSKSESGSVRWVRWVRWVHRHEHLFYQDCVCVVHKMPLRECSCTDEDSPRFR